MRGLFAQYARLLRTNVLHALRQSDHDKWREYEFQAEWALRLERVAEMVPQGSSVFEFGAGPIGLQAYLHPSCRLISSDVVERNPGTMIIDLNRRPLPFLTGTQAQIAVFTGVLEYVSDLPSLLVWVASHFEVCITSYEFAKPKSGALGGIREKLGRGHMGWVNHYTEVEFKALFAGVGFELGEQATWGADDPGEIFLFRLHSC